MSADNPVIERPALGRVEVVETGEGDKVNTAFAVVDASDLIVSNLGDGSINPDFPQELQPRDRTSLNSKMQVLNIAKTLNPAALAGNKFSGKGSPIIGPDNVVESGNGRTLGILRAYGSGMADDYRAWLVANARDFGIEPDAVDQMRQPVLVRVRTDDIDRVKFAIDSNKDVKSAVPDKAMMEAAGESIFAEATDVDDLMQMVKFVGYSDNTNLGILISRWLAQLVNGQMTQSQYKAKVNKVIPEGTPLRENIAAGSDTSFNYGISEGPLVFSSRGAAIAQNIVLNGSVGNIKALGEAWKAGGDDKKATAIQLKAIYQQAAQWSGETKPHYTFFEFWKTVTDGVLTREAFEDAIALVDGTTRRMRSQDEYIAAHGDATAQGVALLKAREAKTQSSIALQVGARKLREQFTKDRATNLHAQLYRATDEQYQAYLDRLETAIAHGRMGHHSAKVEGVANIARQFSAEGKASIRRVIEAACTPLQNQVYWASTNIIENQPAAPDLINMLYYGIDIHPRVKEACDQKWGVGQLEAVIKFSLRLAGGKISTLKSIIPAPRGERSYAQRSGQRIALDSNSGPEVLAHEIGHHFEFSNPNLLGMALEYLRSRMGSKRLRTLKSLCPGYNYKRDEKAIEDKLSEPYIGKVYGGDIAYASSTEVFSMGFQYLWDQESGAQSIMNNDGLLEFVIGAIKGVHSGKY